MKHLFLSMAAVAMLASCSSEEVLDKAQTPKSAIGFSTFVDKSTRATEDDDIKTDNLASFEVNGWRGDFQNFKAQEVNKKTENQTTTWEYTPVQYWETGYDYWFEAIYPNFNKEGFIKTAEAKKGGSEIEFTNGGEIDLLYATASQTALTEINSSSKPNTVSFNFSHLLSRVKFTFTNGFPANAAAKLTVSAVKITDAYKVGKITPATATSWDVSGENNTTEITFPSDNVKDLIPASSSVYNSGVNTSSTEHMYLIPKTIPTSTTSTGTYNVTFTVTLNQNGATTDYPMTATIDENMAMGNSYNYTARITEKNIAENELYPIEFTASVTSWEKTPTNVTWEDNTLDANNTNKTGSN